MNIINYKQKTVLDLSDVCVIQKPKVLGKYGLKKPHILRLYIHNIDGIATNAEVKKNIHTRY